MIQLKFYEPENLDRNLRATIHKSGKLGFTTEAARKMDLSNEKGARIAKNETNPDDESLYILIHPNANKSNFKISKAGQYYYINTAILFDNLKIPYKEFSITYDIEEIENGANKIFRLSIRKSSKRNDYDDIL